MKIFALIFSFYVLTLSLVPCTDIYAEHNHSIETLHDSHSHEAGHENEAQDTCSPFCICVCCGISVHLKLAPLNIQPKIIKKIESKLSFPIRDFSFASHFYGNIWKPPKIA